MVAKSTLTPDAPAPTWPALVRAFATALTEDLRAELAGRLGLPVAATVAVDVGWHPQLAAWTFPERDGDTGLVVGVTARCRDGSRRAVPGSEHGLTLTGGWADHPGPVFVPDGPTDCLALAAVGLAAVGRPSAAGGVNHLAALLGPLPAGRAVYVLGANDRQPDGSWPGRDGAARVAERLAERLQRPVLWALPPGGYADVRAWVADRLAGAAGVDLAAVGADLARTLAVTATAPERPGRLVIRKFPPLKPADRLVAAPAGAAGWVCDGFFPRDEVVLLSALPKCGKSTLLAHLLAALPAGGAFVGRPTTPGRAVVISEESEGVWAERRTHLGLRPEVRFLTRNAWGKVRPADDFDGFVDHLLDELATDPADLIVFDTFPSFWPVADENNAMDVQRAVLKLHPLTPGRCVVIVHHLRKKDGSEGTGTRGSGALAATADVILELRRAKSKPGGNRRTLTGYGRFDCIPPEWTVELTTDPDGKPLYEHVPDGPAEEEPSASRGDELRAAILAILPADGPGIAWADIWDRLPAALRSNEVRFCAVLLAGTGTLWQRDRPAGRNAGFTYRRRATATNERAEKP